MSAISLFDDFYRDVLGSVSDFDAYRLLQGFENMTVASGRALWQLSRQALRVASVRAVLEHEPAEAVTAALTATPEGRRFLAALREYLEAWGQRGDRWGWSFPSWIEDPTPVIKTLHDYVRQPDRDLDGELAAQAAERERLVARARERVRRQPADVRERFEFLLRAAQKAIVLTEDHSHWIDFRCMYHVHQIWLEVGRRFAAAAVLDRPDDVFLLTPDELREAAAAFPRRDQRSRVAARRAEMEYFRHLPVPPTLGAPPSAPAPADPVSAALAKFFGPPAVVAPIAADTSTIPGRRGSPGKATGTARVLTLWPTPIGCSRGTCWSRRRPPRRGRRCSPPPPRLCPTPAASSATAPWSLASTASRPSSAPGTRRPASPMAIWSRSTATRASSACCRNTQRRVCSQTSHGGGCQAASVVWWCAQAVVDDLDVVVFLGPVVTDEQHQRASSQSAPRWTAARSRTTAT